MSKNALIVVDMVYDFTNPKGKVYYPFTEQLIRPLNQFIDKARELDTLIVFIEHTVQKNANTLANVKVRECCIDGSGGEKTDQRIHQNTSDIYVKKTKYSAFFQTKLEHVLKDNNIENLFLVGTKTNNCILATAFDAYYREYNTYVIQELVATSSNELNQIYLNDINKYVAKVISNNEAIALMEEADNR